MKRVLLSIAATAALWAAPSLAADPGAPMEEIPVGFSWTGAYVGVQGGYGWGTSDSTFPPSPTAATYGDLDGFLGGIYAGANWQTGNFVFGIEADANISSVDASSDLNPFGEYIDTDVNWTAGLRGRIGYAIDRWMVYGTGGLAVADVDMAARVLPGVSFATADETLVGWTAGAGLEHAFTDRLIGRAEYRFSDFGELDFVAPAGPGWLDVKMHTVSVGIAYKF